MRTYIIGPYPLPWFDKSLKRGVLSKTFFFPSHNRTLLFPQTMPSFQDNKTFPSLSLESILSFTPIFTFMATKHSFFPHFVSFIYLIALLSWYKLGKMLTSFESPYMVCTCRVMQSYHARALDRRLQVDWARDAREGPKVLMSLRADFGPMG